MSYITLGSITFRKSRVTHFVTQLFNPTLYLLLQVIYAFDIYIIIVNGGTHYAVTEKKHTSTLSNLSKEFTA